MNAIVVFLLRLSFTTSNTMKLILLISILYLYFECFNISKSLICNFYWWNEYKIVCFYNMYFIIAFAWIITTSAYALLHSGSFRSKTKKNALFNLNLYSFAISQFMYTFWCHCSANYLENEVFQYCLAGMKLSHFRLQYFHKYVLMQLSLRITFVK